MKALCSDIVVFVIILFSTNYYGTCQNFEAPKETYEALYSLKYSGYKFDYIVYIYKNKVYLPLFNMLSNLKIYNNFNQQDAIVSGYSANPENDFVINFAKYEYKFKNEKGKIKADEFFFKDADFYLSTDLIQKILGFKLSVSNSSLYVYLNSQYDLPILADDKRKGVIVSNKIDDGSFAPLVYDRDWYLLGGGLMDFNLGAGRYQKYNNYSYSGNIGMQVLFGDLQANGYGTYNQQSKSEKFDYNYRWRLFLGDNGVISQINIGDLTNSAVRINSMPSRKLKGAQISNEIFQTPLFFDNTVIQDYIEPGWTVELYKNGVLVDQKTTDAVGYYKFQIPVMYGNNNLELKFYGTRGEFRVTQALLNIPSEFYKPGEVRYHINAGKAESDSIYMTDSWLSIGLTNWLSNSFNFVKRFSSSNEPDFNDHLAVRFDKNMYATIDYQHKNLYKATLNSYFSNSSSIILAYTGYDNNSYTGMKNHIDLNVSSSRIFSLPVSLSILLNRTQYGSGANSNATTAIYGYFYPFNIQLKYGTSIQEAGKRLTVSNQSIYNELSYSWYRNPKWLPFLQSSRLAVSYNYDIDNNKLIDLSALFDQNIGNIGNLNIRFSHDFQNRVNSFQAGLNLNLSFMRMQSNGDFEKNGNSYSQSFQGAVGFDHHSGDFFFTNATGMSTVGNGAANIHFFLDTNSNGKLDKGEYEIPNVEISIPNASCARAVKGNSTLAYNLQPYGRFNLTINPESIKNPNWIPQYSTFSFIADPNVYKEINVPCYSGGVIEGSVFYSDSGKHVGQSGVKVHIVNKESNYSSEVAVFADGSFYKMGVPPGKYEIWVDSSQCAILDAKPVKNINTFTVNKKIEGDYVSNLDLEIVHNENFAAKIHESEKKIVKTYDNTNETDVSKNVDLIDNVANIVPKNIDSSNTEVKNNEPEKIKDDFEFNGHKTFYYKTIKSYQLTPEITKYLDKLAEYLKSKPKVRLSITGHTDGTADLASNMKISENRAKLVAKYIISKGIQKNRVLYNGKGALYPVASNATPEGRQKNRRVEIDVVP